MNREQALSILGAHGAELEALGVTSASVFGSVARNEARPDSDVDVLVELRSGIGLIRFAQIQDYLETLLGRRVDLVTPDALRRQMRDAILAEAVRAA
jgi:predicted nucleotidyltransferase